MSNYDLTRNNLDNRFGGTDKLKLRSLVTELKSTLRLVTVPTVHSRRMGCGCMVRVSVNED